MRPLSVGCARSSNTAAREKLRVRATWTKVSSWSRFIAPVFLASPFPIACICASGWNYSVWSATLVLVRLHRAPTHTAQGTGALGGGARSTRRLAGGRWGSTRGVPRTGSWHHKFSHVGGEIWHGGGDGRDPGLRTHRGDGAARGRGARATGLLRSARPAGARDRTVALAPRPRAAPSPRCVRSPGSRSEEDTAGI